MTHPLRSVEIVTALADKIEVIAIRPGTTMLVLVYDDGSYVALDRGGFPTTTLGPEIGWAVAKAFYRASER